MSAVDVTQKINKEAVESNEVLYSIYENFVKEFKSKKKEKIKIKNEDIYNLLDGIINFAVSKALSEKIYTDWKYDLFITLLNGVYRHVMQNLNDESSRVYMGIVSGEICWEEIGILSPFDKNPLVWKEIKITLAERDKAAGERFVIVSDKKCGKCKRNEIFSLSRQTRSADEPETHFYVCMFCGNTWRTSG
jgi:DNA-directed RNA polymerase subunit M/transcription elongation factor TFIIS